MTLMISDVKLGWLDPLKAQLLSSMRPLYEAADLPDMVSNWSKQKIKSKSELSLELAKLESENIVLRGKLQKLTAIAIENVRLRELLNATSLFEENVLVAEIISVSSDLNSQHVVLNKGKSHGIYEGQAVIDAYGLFGQVMEVGASVSRVLLISDSRHSVPVQVNRNGLRFIVEGDDDFHHLKLPHIALTTDIVEGDVLSTSGLGQLFPTGYPVAKIETITHSPGSPFAVVNVVPFAKLNQSRHVLLLFSEERQQIAHIKEPTVDGESKADEEAALKAADAENESVNILESAKPTSEITSGNTAIGNSEEAESVQ